MYQKFNQKNVACWKACLCSFPTVYCILLLDICYIRAYTFEDTGVGQVSGLRIYLHGLYRLLGVGCDIIG